MRLPFTRACLFSLLLLAGCAQLPPAAEPAVGPELLLLGEVHDNPAGHAAREALLRARVEAGWRPVVVMEMFDRERQPQLDAAMAECADADCVVRRAAGEGAGWQWPLYAPVIELALRHRLPLVAGNLSRTELGTLMRGGDWDAVFDATTIARFGLDPPLPADVLQPQVDAVRLGHCDMLPQPMLAPMARAQIARDVWMARALLDAGGDAVLLAGNGHVRDDVGVPWWLRHAGATGYRTVAWVESAVSATQQPEAVLVPPVERADPCEAFRSRR